jgi:hypothetical protein
MGFGLVIEFPEHLQIVTTSHYNAISNSHILQYATARTKSFQSAVSSVEDIPLLLGSRPRTLAAIPRQPSTFLTAVLRLLIIYPRH